MPKNQKDLIYGEQMESRSFLIPAATLLAIQQAAWTQRISVPTVVRERLWDAFHDRVTLVGPVQALKASKAPQPFQQASIPLPKALREYIEDMAFDLCAKPRDVVAHILDLPPVSKD